MSLGLTTKEQIIKGKFIYYLVPPFIETLIERCYDSFSCSSPAHNNVVKTNIS